MEPSGPRAQGAEPTGPAGRGPWLALCAVLVVALGLRLARLGEVRSAPDFARPAVDAAFHDWWARELAGLGDPGGRDADRASLLERAYLRPPGYPLALAAVYRATGGSHLGARWFQLLLGTAAAGLGCWVLARASRPWVGLAGGAAIGAHWLPLYFEGELQATSLVIALLLGATAVYALWFERPGPLRAGSLGLVLGLAAVVRPNALFVLLAAGLLLLLELRRRGQRSAPHLLALGLGAALAIGPVTARNWLAAGEPVLISTNAGVNLYMGNHPEATGRVASHLEGLGAFETCFDYPQLVRRVEKRVGRSLSDAEVSRWFADRAWGWIADEPAAALALTARKAVMLLGPREVSHNKELAFERSSSAVLSRLPFPFALLLAGALVGFAASRRRPRGDAQRALASFAAGGSALWLLSVLPFFVAARYRVPILPWLTLLSALGLHAGWEAVKLGRARTALLGAVGCGALWALLSVPFYRPQPDLAKWHHDRGSALLRDGRPAEALVELDAAREAEPGRPSVELSRANALAALGRREAAAEGYRRVLERRPGDRDALNNLAVQLAESGRLDEAVPLFERALERARDPAPLHLNLGRAYEQLGRQADARRHYAALLEGPGAGRAAVREARGALERLGPEPMDLEYGGRKADDGVPPAARDRGLDPQQDASSP